METTVYHALLTLISHLPSHLAYPLGVLIGGLQYHADSSTRSVIAACLELVFGDQTAFLDRVRATHEWFHQRACEDIDKLRLAGDGKRFAKLVEIRGREHLERALAQGRGAVLGSAHFGSWEAAVGLIGAQGFPVALVAEHRYMRRSRIRKTPSKFFQILREDAFSHHLAHPVIAVGSARQGFDRRSTVVSEATAVARQNEFVFIMMDEVGSRSHHPGAPQINFLGGSAYMPTGAIRIARSAGAPLLFCLIHRTSDWRHQVIEITPPISTDGDIAEVNRVCMKLIEDAVRKKPAHWRKWSLGTMGAVGLLPEPRDQTDAATLRDPFAQ